MIRKQMSDDVIAALAAKRKRYVAYDSIVTSLGVRVSPKGKKTFIVVGRFMSSSSRKAISPARNPRRASSSSIA